MGKHARLAATALALVLAANGQRPDNSPHRVQFVQVETNVKLEVLDWGGSGRPIVLLTGLGDNAHVFDTFAVRLTPGYHVYGITRRGFGASSVPAAAGNAYTADRLGDDVLSVIASLKLDRPVLIGHSIAGEELSSIGSRHPEKVAGLVYLDAGYAYAFYDPSAGDLTLDLMELKAQLARVGPGAARNDQRPAIEDVLRTLPIFENDLRKEHAFLDALPASALEGPSSSPREAARAIREGERKYTAINAPVLAIFALPHDMGSALNRDDAKRAAFDVADEAYTGPQAAAFEKGVPGARVVRISHANHYVFRSNEPEVLKEIENFIATLP